jgi:hypothetical protein
MTATLVVYESKYGVSETVAGHLGRVLGPARVCRVSELLQGGAACDAYLRAAEFVVIVAPVYRHLPDERIQEFVRARADELRARRVALVCVGLATSAGAVRAYLQPLTDLLGDCVVWTGGLGGRIALDWLDAPDREDVEQVQDMRGHRGLGDLDAYSAEAVAEAALAIKVVRDSFARAMPADELRAHIDDFLARHVTCTLGTGAGGHVRATPVEYGYRDGRLYLLSEGGEKFAHLLVNPHVSIAVYDSYQGMDKLAGLQLLGVAGLVADDSPERAEALHLRGLGAVRLAALPFALNLIRVSVERAEFLWSGFGALGFDVRQVYQFPPADAPSRLDPAPPGEPRA